MKECIFCKIINGEIPSKKIYEDDLIEVIMNINPISNGHLLVIPKEHIININEITDEIITHSLKIIRKDIYPKLKSKLNCEGLTLVQNNELGQEIKHYHIHLIPRYSDDTIDFKYEKDKIEDIDSIYNKIK